MVLWACGGQLTRGDTESPSTPADGTIERRLNVLYLDHCAQLSGGEIALARLVASLRGSRLSCEVVLGEPGHLEDLLAGSATVSVVPLPASTRHLRRAMVNSKIPMRRVLWDTTAYVIRLAAILRRRSPDLVVTNSLKAALYGGTASRLARVPVVWHLRDRVAPDYLPRPAVLLVRLAARALPLGIVANSVSTLATLKLPPGRRRRRPYAAAIGDPIARPPTPPARGDGPLVVGMVGRLAPWKGQEIFLRAFARAFPSGPERAIVVGGALFEEDAYAASLPRLAADLGLEERVEFVGHVVDVGSYYERMDVLVHASTVPEPFGQVIVEGMAQGIPVVAAAAGGPTEIVTDRVDGILYPPSDVGALAEVLQQLASDRELRERIGRAAWVASGRFAPAVIARETESFYRSVVERQASGRPRRLERSPR
jgi:glycosyltransferase involved in cell wall biosynthesis